MFNKIVPSDSSIKLQTWPTYKLGLLLLLFPLLFTYFHIADFRQGGINTGEFLHGFGVFIIPMLLVALAIASVKKEAVFYNALMSKSLFVLGFKITSKEFKPTDFKSIALILTSSGTSTGTVTPLLWLVVIQSKTEQAEDAKLITLRVPKELLIKALVQASTLTDLPFSGKVDGLRSPWGVEYDHE